MRDELSHIRNQRDEHRRQVLAEHQKIVKHLFAKYPELKKNHMQIEAIKKQIISKTLAKLQGKPLDEGINDLELLLEELNHQRRALLDKYKLDPSVLEPKWDCPNCQDSGRVYTEAGRYQPCSCIQRGRDNILRTATALPPRLVNASFDNVNFDLYQPQYRQQAKNIFSYVKNFCDKLADNPNQGLFVHGPTGSGKSYLMGCIANYLCSQLSVKYLVYADFLDSLRATYSARDTGYSEQQLIDEVKNVDLLLLDDLGVEKSTEFAQKNLAQIVDNRYRRCLPIVVTSNFTLEELIKRSHSDLYGERIVWRLSEICSNILELQGNLRLNL